ncbi:hypothetical protein ACFTAO_43640 [Paenibacillus rhizoplanae]
MADYRRQLDAMANTIANGEVQVTIPSGSTLPAGTTVLKDSEIINADGTKNNSYSRNRRTYSING